MKVRSLSRIVLGVAGVCLGLAALGSPAWARTFQDQQAQAQQNLMPPTPPFGWDLSVWRSTATQPDRQRVCVV